MAWLQLKGEQLSGSAYYFNGCKALMFSSVVRFNQATQQLSTWVKAHGVIYRVKRRPRLVLQWFGLRSRSLMLLFPKYPQEPGSRRRKGKKKSASLGVVRQSDHPVSSRHCKAIVQPGRQHPDS
ncbi:unnamed protein product [Pleuronectes platessa]|uniref:Uncharacterized protein n=1 Tax=Pleuronectes platessa TaxID=8262 RepID=A0A9N7VXS6_PLEPL|nr:unnamed protein product [Pleuronectes platessa]